MADDVLRVPLHYYNDPKLTELEESQILRRTPLAVMQSCRIPAPNDYVVRSVLGDSLLITRDADGKSHVFLNYCRHRGAMPACGAGNARRFTCPYHAWTYKNTGELAPCPGRRDSPAWIARVTAWSNYPPKRNTASSGRSSPPTPTSTSTTTSGPSPTDLAALEFETYGYHTEKEFESEVSWKGSLEAFAEGYHFQYVHPNSIGQGAIGNTTIHDAFGKHHRLGFPLMQITNLDTIPMRAGNVRNNLGIIYWIFPNLVLANSPVGVEVIDILPAGSPTRCTVRHSWMARIPATNDDMRAGYDYVFNLVHAALTDEDFVMLPQCGEAVQTRTARPYDHRPKRNRRATHDPRSGPGTGHCARVMGGSVARTPLAGFTLGPPRATSHAPGSGGCCA